MFSIPSFFRLVVIHARALLRNPVCMLIALSVAIITLMLPLAFAHTFGDSASRLARDGGLAFQLMAGIALAAYGAGAMTGRARQSGSDAMMLVKPISPTIVFLARYAGIALVLLIVSITCAVSTVLAQRIAEAFSPTTGWRLDMTTATIAVCLIVLACGLAAIADATKLATFHTACFCLLPLLLSIAALLTGFYDRAGHLKASLHYTLDPSTVVAALLITTALLLFAAIALSLSLWLSPVSVAAACFLLLTVGLSVDWLLALDLPRFIRAVILTVLPNWQRFWSPATQGVNSATLVGTTILYAGLYTAAILTLGCRGFEQSEHV